MKRHLRWTAFASLLTIVAAGPVLAASDSLAYTVDSASSRVTFKVRSTGHSFEGVAEEVRGSLTMGEAGYSDGAAGAIEVPVKNMKTGIGKRDRIMRGETLEAETYPLIRLETTGLNPPAGALSEGETYVLQVSGNLSIHGVTHPVTVPVQVTRQAEGLTLEGDFAVQLPDYDITPPSFLFFRVKDEVKVSFHLTARPDHNLSANSAAGSK